MKDKCNRVVRAVMWTLSLLLLVCCAVELLHLQRTWDGFYTSAIPNDPVHLGVRPYVVKWMLGEPAEEIVVKDFTQVGFAGNDFELRATGEIILVYQSDILGENATVQYSYQRGKNTIDSVTVSVGSYQTAEEAVAVVDMLLEYAQQPFRQKGAYTLKKMDAVIPCLAYRLQVENQGRSFLFEISITNVNETYGFSDEKPYMVRIYQS